MRDILIKRNALKNNSIRMRSMRFEPHVKSSQVEKLAEEQNKMYNHWKFYDKFIKAREEVKNEIKFDNMGEAK